MITHKLGIYAFISGLIIMPHSAFAEDKLNEHVHGRIDEIFSAYNRTDSPGCTVAVYRNGGIVFWRSYGMANLDEGIANGLSTSFHVASVSKQFTAYATALLVQQGALSLDDKVTRFIPELSSVAAHVTVRQLLHHTSGLRDELELLWMAGWRDDGDVKKLPDVLGLLRQQQRLNSSPGTEHMYINTGYTLLAEIVRRASGKSLRQLTSERIFRPLDMSSTEFVDDSNMINARRAIPYRAVPGGGFSMARRRFDYVGAMGLHTTVQDLAKWERNLLEGTVGGAELIAGLHQPGRLLDGTDTDYGFGVHIGAHRGMPAIYHDGVDSGYRSTFLRFPEQRMAFATLCNEASANTSLLSRSVADHFLHSVKATSAAAAAPLAAPFELKDPARYAGWFVNQSNGIIREIKLRGGKLKFSWGNGEVEMVPIGPDRFRRGSLAGETQIRLNASGEPTEMVVGFEAGECDAYTHLGRKVFTPNKSYLAAFQNTYFSPELGVSWRAVVKDGDLVLEVPRNGGIVLRPLGGDRFGSISPLGYFIEFIRSGTGRIEGFLASNPRVRALRFRRKADYASDPAREIQSR